MLIGGSANDTLTGGAGNDTIDGGAGTATRSLSAGRAPTTRSRWPARPITITDNRGGSPDGTDTVTNVENFQFSDGTVTAAVSSAASDAAEQDRRWKT